MSTQVSLSHTGPATLEVLSACPVCFSRKIVLLYESMDDRIFGVPGTWSLWRCRDCDVAFLNPRLTPDTIADAYRSYYTHTPAATESARSIRSRFREFAIRSFAKSHLGTTATIHAVWAEWIVPWLAPGVAKHVAAQHRYLPRPQPDALLLDVGCGNGEFLSRVQALGWRAIGLEFDPKACAAGASRGLHIVQASVPNTPFAPETFDAITMHHVIEHVHNPQAVLNELFRLLKPGGTVVLTTPNWQSYGASFFGPSWRGLEPPRHLVLFTPDALLRLVADIGFINAEVHVRPELAYFYFERSYAIANGSSPASTRLPEEMIMEVDRARAAASADSRCAEEFTLLATKPTTTAKA